MKLIDVDKFKQRVKNSTASSPVKFVSLVLAETQDTIDPIHAAGGCYCKECKYHENEVYPDGEWEVHDNEECWCNWWDNTVLLNGFCSYGKRGDTNNVQV